MAVAGQSDATIVQVVLSLDRGGLEAMAVDLAIALKQAGFRSHVIALDTGGLLEARLQQGGIKYEILGGRHFRDPGFHLSLATRFRRMQAGVIHTHHFAPLLHTIPAARIAGISRAVHTEHSFEYLLPRPSLRYALRWMSRATDVFALVGERMRSYYESSVGVSARRLHVIPNGIDLHRYEPNARKEPLRAELQLPTDAFIVGSAGRLAPEKNYQLLLDAVSRNRRLGRAMHLVFFGEGEERTLLEKTAMSLGVTDAVSFLGWRTDLFRLLPALDAFALTSTREGLPLAVLEAMACGLPVVSTAVGDIPVVVQDDHSGYLVPSGDAEALASRLWQLASEPATRCHMGENARRVVRERYSRAAMVDRYISAYGHSMPT